MLGGKIGSKSIAVRGPALGKAGPALHLQSRGPDRGVGGWGVVRATSATGMGFGDPPLAAY
jgi:hypothetical protein